MKKKCLIYLLAAMLLLVPAWATAAAQIPEPTEVFYVADYANVLQSDTENTIVEMNRELHQKTGAEIVIVTVDFLSGAEIEDYAMQLFNDWGIGSSSKNNGVLLLLVIGEENYWCVQGRGLESQLSSGKIQTILDTYLENDFAAGDYDSGVQKTFQALLTQVTSFYDVSINGQIDTPIPEDEGSFFDGFVNIIITILGILLVIFVVLAIVKAPCCCFCCNQPMPPGGPPRRFHRPPRPPRPPGGFGGFGAGRRPGGFGGGSGGGRSGGGGFSRGGGGSTRGGGAGRR